MPAAVRARRLDELLYCDARLAAGAIQQDPAYLNILSCPDDVTVLEVALHTRGLQVPPVSSQRPDWRPEQTHCAGGPVRALPSREDHQSPV